MSPSDFSVSESGLHEVDLYVGKKLREKRKKLRLTLAQLAEKLNVSLQQVQKYEQGKTRLSAGMIYQLSTVLGVTSNYFFAGFVPDGSAQRTRSDTISPQRKVEKIHILVVEDDPADELLVRRALEGSDVHVDIFVLRNGEDVLRFLSDPGGSKYFPRPDLILLDLNIPKMNGHEVLRHIKRDRLLQDIPVVVLTNSISVQEMMNVYRAYGAGYISKSFDFDVFQKSILGMVSYWSQVVVLPRTA